MQKISLPIAATPNIITPIPRMKSFSLCHLSKITTPQYNYYLYGNNYSNYIVFLFVCQDDKIKSGDVNECRIQR